MKNVNPIPKARCINGIDYITPIGNTNALSGAQSSSCCLLDASLLARRDSPLTASLKARRCKVLLHDYALMFSTGERPKSGELLEDNSSSTGASASSSSGIMSSFPRL